MVVPETEGKTPTVSVVRPRSLTLCDFEVPVQQWTTSEGQTTLSY